jgi:hypothetical protein
LPLQLHNVSLHIGERLVLGQVALFKSLHSDAAINRSFLKVSNSVMKVLEAKPKKSPNNDASAKE